MPEETSYTSFATRRELDMLLSRVESIERDGTRGMVAVQTQLTDTVKDLAELKLDFSKFQSDTSAWFTAHAKQHEEERLAREQENEVRRRDRITDNRWRIGMIVAALAAIGGMYEFLNVILQHVH